MPSFGFVACANAFVARGAQMVFVDIRPQTMNIDERLIEEALTPKTKVILAINYSGIGCEYDAIKRITGQHGLLLVEDNAQGLFGKYKGKNLGSFGDAATVSFDHLKNITCGQGGALSFNENMRSQRLEYYYEFGTNKAEFLRGQSSSYEWKSMGSNFYLPELLAAFLFSQLSEGEQIIHRFMQHWAAYEERLRPLAKQGKIELLEIPAHCEHNAHNFCIKTQDQDERARLMDYLKSQGIHSTFHYLPLHSSSFGKQAGRFHGADRFTSFESGRLLRLPLFYDLTEADIDRVCGSVYAFYKTPY
jgi:dTDP-4-amino-4,6-dideoxygalactose transaminase